MTLWNFPLTYPDCTALIVGGAVRDFLLGESPKDFDLEVQNISQKSTLSILAKHGTVELVGASFGVFKVTTPQKNTYDVSLPKTENSIGKGHKDFEIHTDPTLPFATSALRRDLTINAMAWNPTSKTLIDPFGGKPT